jgi:hypothetical protein
MLKKMKELKMYPINPQGIVLDPEQDGITHINVYSKARTLLGQKLSHFAYSPFIHPVYGDFHSLEAFWHWLSTGRCHDFLRYLSGAVAKTSGGSLPKVPLDTFDVEFAQALNLRIDQDIELQQLLKHSVLPFTHYYVMSDRVLVPSKHQWVLNVVERRRLEEQNR